MLLWLISRLACAEPSSNRHCVCHASRALYAACPVGSGSVSLALSHLRLYVARVMAASRCLPMALLLGSYRASPAPSHLLTFIACAMPARAARHLLFRLTPHLACAEPSSKPYRLCRRSTTLLVTCSLGSYRASPALSRLPTFTACVMRAMRCMPPAL